MNVINYPVLRVTWGSQAMQCIVTNISYVACCHCDTVGDHIYSYILRTNHEYNKTFRLWCEIGTTFQATVEVRQLYTICSSKTS